ncbi:hypothetical protein PRUB_b1446 [Pseudoalteromonas rubra]|uniref:Uncharacterized protein n=1 Tax=Pseudoalteromonas rubra TaxID=43658 RepID=A0A8T0C200_9GAMM|nr:hypothetical protein PRUB_b1446 [Pseudoalteromonas rubra]
MILFTHDFTQLCLAKLCGTLMTFLFQGGLKQSYMTEIFQCDCHLTRYSKLKATV